ncbi:MAG TPA: hypothetical protein PKK40_08515 [Marmoricola sp.]|nr:hypothetical protein [Marmoricola sp.]
MSKPRPRASRRTRPAGAARRPGGLVVRALLALLVLSYVEGLDDRFPLVEHPAVG